MAAARTTLTGEFVKLADAGEFVLINNSAITIHVAVTDVAPASSVDMVEAVTLPPFGQLPAINYDADIYARADGSAGSVTLIPVAPAT
jgi:hypothetical protein